MTEPNLSFPAPGSVVRFVGGAPSVYMPNAPLDLEHVYEGEAVGKPLWADGQHFIPVRVPGMGHEILVRAANLR